MSKLQTEIYSSALPDTPADFTALRESALADFLSNGYPHKKLENWRYTDLSAMAERHAGHVKDSAAASGAPGKRSETYTSEDSITLLFRDGVPDTGFDTTADGLTITALPTAAKQFGDYLSTTDDSSLSKLNLAFLDTGVVIEIADNTEIEKPLHIVFDNTSARSSYPRVLIRAGKQSSAVIIEHHTGTTASNTIAVTDIYCEPGARLTYQKVQEESAEAYHVANQNLFLKRDSYCDFLNIDLGAKMARNDLQVHLQDQGATFHTNALFLVDDARHADNHLYLAHEAPHTESRAHYAGVMAERGRGVFNGMIHVFKDAQKTNSALYNKNLLLSKGSEINTKPELEIYADDVKCAHGSTTGQLDPASLFYLQARGIPKQQARNMLIQSFAAEVLLKIATDGLREHVHQAVEQRLNELGADTGLS